MLQLEEFMEVQKLFHDGVSITEIARRLAKGPQDGAEVCATSASGVSAASRVP
jgi:hypothetical protein